jgi:hypothetical protein
MLNLFEDRSVQFQRERGHLRVACLIDQCTVLTEVRRPQGLTSPCVRASIIGVYRYPTELHFGPKESIPRFHYPVNEQNE